jgi:hypothetical protein
MLIAVNDRVVKTLPSQQLGFEAAGGKSIVLQKPADRADRGVNLSEERANPDLQREA